VLQDDIGFPDFRAIYLVFEDLTSICGPVSQRIDRIDDYIDSPSSGEPVQTCSEAEPSARFVGGRQREICGFRLSEAFYERHGHENYDEDQGQRNDYGGGLERAQPAQDEQSDGDEP
jgi:hypothetical protein